MLVISVIKGSGVGVRAEVRVRYAQIRREGGRMFLKFSRPQKCGNIGTQPNMSEALRVCVSMCLSIEDYRHKLS